jgi:hypothetical protein
LLTGAHAEVLQDVLPKRNLTLRGNSKRAHWIKVRHNILTVNAGSFADVSKELMESVF